MKIDQSLEGKRVKLIDIDGTTFEGIVGDYIYPEDNEPEGIAAIDIYDCPQDVYKRQVYRYSRSRIACI